MPLQWLWQTSMAKLIDANVILRYLLDDDSQMAETAQAAIQEGAFTIPSVIAEVVYVLSGVYRTERSKIASVLVRLLDEVSIEDKDVVDYGLTLYGKTKLDFVDCLLIARNRVLGDEVLTFDKKMSRWLTSKTEQRGKR